MCRLVLLEFIRFSAIRDEVLALPLKLPPALLSDLLPLRLLDKNGMLTLSGSAMGDTTNRDYGWAAVMMSCSCSCGCM